MLAIPVLAGSAAYGVSEAFGWHATLEAKAPDINLQPDDILFVPLSGARVAAGQTLNAAISAATGIAVIAAHP